jgi:hypothetical protein
MTVTVAVAPDQDLLFDVTYYDVVVDPQGGGEQPLEETLRFKAQRLQSEGGAVRLSIFKQTTRLGTWVVSPSSPLFLLEAAKAPNGHGFRMALWGDALLTLDLDPGRVEFVTNDGIGYIKEAFMRSGETAITVIPKNAGTVRTAYVLGAECDGGVAPIRAQGVTLDPNGKATLRFEVNPRPPTGVCIVTLMSSSGRKFDSVEVYY